MTELLYMKDIESNYIREFDASVVERGFDYVVLDRTAFYPLGGGQPSDTGRLEWPGGQAQVREVTKKEGVRHHLAQNPELVPDKVHGVVDWEKRYGHMRMHTAQHIVSGVVYDLWKARTVGNQLYHDRSRIDFAPVKFTDEMISELESRTNEILATGAKVEIRHRGQVRAREGRGLPEGEPGPAAQVRPGAQGRQGPRARCLPLRGDARALAGRDRQDQGRQEGEQGEGAGTDNLRAGVTRSRVRPIPIRIRSSGVCARS